MGVYYNGPFERLWWWQGMEEGKCENKLGIAMTEPDNWFNFEIGKESKKIPWIWALATG